MADRTLTIVIDVDDRDAKTTLQQADRAIDKIASTADSTAASVAAYDKQVQALVQSKQALTTTTLATVETLNATRTAVSTNAAEMSNLLDWVNRSGQGWEGYKERLGDVALATRDLLTLDVQAWGERIANGWSSLVGVFAAARAGLNGLAEAAGLTVASLGLINSAGLVLATGYGSWKIGTMIGEFTGLSKAIGNATASLLGWTSTKEAGLAAQDAINLAIARGGVNITTQAQALAFNTQWVKNMNEAWRELAETNRRANAFDDNSESIAKWRAELQKVQSEGQLQHLIEDLQTGYFSTDQLSKAYVVSAGALQLLTKDLKAEADAQREASQAAKAHSAELKRQQEEYARLLEHVHRAENGYVGVSSELHHLGTIEAPVSKSWLDNNKALTAELARVEKGTLATANTLEHLGQVVSKPIAPKDTLLGGLKDLFKGDFSSGFTQIKTSLGNALDPSAILNSAAGGFLSGGISAGIGLITKGVGSLFSKIFGNPEKEINPVREAYVQAAGGLAALNERAMAATGSLALVQNLLNAKNAQQYTAAINALNDAFTFQDSSLQTVKETADKYGITLEQLGPKFRQSQLNEQLLQLYQDQRVLTAAGADFDLILQKQASSFQTLITTALQTGATIPVQLQPAVQRLIDLGLVTDLTGEKLTDIGKLTFAETLDQKFTTLIATINKLADAISNSLGGAINSLPDKTVHIGFEVDNAPRELQSYHQGGVVLPWTRAHSGLAIDEVPIIAQRGEGILNRGAMKRIGGANGLNALNAGGGGVSVNLGHGAINVSSGMSGSDAEELIGKTIVKAMRRRGVRFG